LRLEGLGKLKNCTSSGIEPATFQLVAVESEMKRMWKEVVMA
jgi:hypothetical protein